MDQGSEQARSEAKQTLERLLDLGDAVFRLTHRLRANAESGAVTANAIDEWNNAQQAYVLAIYEARTALARLASLD